MKVKARKRYWLANGSAIAIIALYTYGIALALFPLIWMVDKTLARAAYMREEKGLPPSWYDGFSKWEFERSD